jgi:hypothetical protein
MRLIRSAIFVGNFSDCAQGQKPKAKSQKPKAKNNGFDLEV